MMCLSGHDLIGSQGESVLQFSLLVERIWAIIVPVDKVIVKIKRVHVKYLEQ